MPNQSLSISLTMPLLLLDSVCPYELTHSPLLYNFHHYRCVTSAYKEYCSIAHKPHQRSRKNRLLYTYGKQKLPVDAMVAELVMEASRILRGKKTNVIFVPDTDNMPETSAQNSNQDYFSSQEYCVRQESFKYSQLLYATRYSNYNHHASKI